MDLPSLLPTLVGVAGLVSLAAALLCIARVPQWWSPLSAIARAAVQLAVLSVILTGVINDPVWVAAALSLIFTVAVVVATRRTRWTLRGMWRTALAMGAGSLAAIGIVFASGAVEFTPRYVLAVSAIVIGSAMTISALSGRHFAQGRLSDWPSIEGWLAIGATPRQAVRDIARAAVRDALIPSIDQTKTTGLVVLPGAFVGAIFGGLSPAEAGRFQLVVLAAILAAGAITSVLTVWLAAGDPRRPQPLR